MSNGESYKTQNNEATEKQNKIREELIKERDSNQQIIESGRDFHSKQLIANQQQFLNFIVKLGELSLVIGAAIGPIIIVSNGKIAQPIYVFLAVIIYLLNGIIAIWKAKDITEKQVDAFAPGTFNKFEIDAYPLQFSINKLIWKPENQDYINDYINKRIIFLRENIEAETSKTKIDISLDIFVLNFVFASLLLIRTIWPFNAVLYWILFSAITLLSLSLAIFGYIQARERAIKNECNAKRLNDMKKEHIDWQKREIFHEK